ncbi:MAG TPA: hypothetical protein VGL18_13140 [Actinomycetota bacterium]
MKRRWRAWASVMMVALITGTLPGLARATGRPGQRASEDPVRILRIYYQAPGLVKAGEQVVMPVHVDCVTARGRACDATVSLGVRTGVGDAWRFQTVDAGPGLAFDLTAPAARAASSADQSVAFFLQAKAETATSSLPANDGPPLRFYSTRQLRPVRVAAVPFGRLRKGRTVLSLQWGSGSMRAGLTLGRESPTLGPSAFDVDRAGHVYLLDALQGRIAEFKRSRLLRQRWVQADPAADLAVATDGTAYVAHVHEGVVGMTRLSGSGRDLGTVTLGPGVLSQVRMAGSAAYAELLPLDAWVRVPASRGRASRLAPISGRPLASGEQVLRVGTERSIRLGIVRNGSVHGAVELRSAHRFGEVALAEPDGAGGYVVVVRVWRWRPQPADQFQVIHISNGHVAETFAVSSRSFAEARPLSRFRLGPDGRLYQMVTGPAGVGIVRFEMKGES